MVRPRNHICFSSCSYEHWIDVVVSVPDTHPFEEACSESLWFSFSWFDGERVRYRHIAKGERSTAVSVRAGGLRVFVFEPLGELGGIGAFFEPGDNAHVQALPEYGAFASMLLRAAEYRAEPVSRLSMKDVMDSVPDLQAVDETAFLEDVFNGTLSYGIKENEKHSFRLSSIPEGFWVSERFDVPSFVQVSSGDPVDFYLYPGVYRYAEAERKLLLTVIIDEEGEVSQMITAMPVW